MLYNVWSCKPIYAQIASCRHKIHVTFFARYELKYNINLKNDKSTYCTLKIKVLLLKQGTHNVQLIGKEANLRLS